MKMLRPINLIRSDFGERVRAVFVLKLQRRNRNLMTSLGRGGLTSQWCCTVSPKQPVQTAEQTLQQLQQCCRPAKLGQKRACLARQWRSTLELALGRIAAVSSCLQR